MLFVCQSQASYDSKVNGFAKDRDSKKNRSIAKKSRHNESSSQDVI
jgi:hypothetical protein